MVEWSSARDRHRRFSVFLHVVSCLSVVAEVTGNLSGRFRISSSSGLDARQPLQERLAGRCGMWRGSTVYNADNSVIGGCNIETLG